MNGNPLLVRTAPVLDCTRNRLESRRLATLATVVLLSAPVALPSAPLAAQVAYQLEVRHEAPAGVPEWAAALVGDTALSVSDASGVFGTFWVRPELPSRSPSGELGVDFGRFPGGTLVGLLDLARDWSDYRKQAIPAGRYTMRYGVQPADGDHMGQTYFRDFLMLVPLAEDAFDPDGDVDQELIVESAKKTTGTAHPAVMGLYQIYDPVEEISIVPNDYSEPCLAVPLGDLVMGLVLEGHGQDLPV